jgi:hypothetical protein
LCKITEKDLENIIDIKYPSGIELAAEIVKVSCPACGEEFIGTKGGAGGFIAGHEAYHRHENSLDLLISALGGA